MSLKAARALLSHARAASLGSNRKTTGSRVGRFASRIKGSGLEFADLRVYTPGDDVRSIDWNVTARSDDVFVREYVEERNRTFVVAFDVSASASFGSEESKRAVMLEVAASVLLGALDDQDRFAAVTFTDRIETKLAPGSGEEHALRVLSAFDDAAELARPTDLDPVLTRLRSLYRKDAVFVIISDFDSPDFSDALRRLSLDSEVVGIRILDPVERVLPDVGLISLVDPETGDELVVDASDPRIRDAYERLATQLDERVRASFVRSRARLVDMLTIDDPQRAISRTEAVR